MRQIVLDTETTGLDPKAGHKLIEIGCVELEDRRLTGNNFHQYINPDREVEAGAVEVHGITNEFLADKPAFAEVAQGFLDYVAGSELIIHNAAFDQGFIDHELDGWRPDGPHLGDLCEITDTLDMARRMHPGQRNSLDALCKRYGIDNTHRELHGALLDAEILADVYLAMTGGQVALQLGIDDGVDIAAGAVLSRGSLPADRPRLRVVAASELELAVHAARLDAIDGVSSGACVWRRSASAD